MSAHKWYEHRRFDPSGREGWQKRVAEDHPEINAVYPPGFWRAYRRFCAGDTAGMEMAVTFLEDDPWVFGSGCIKEDFIHALKHMEIPGRYISRLHRVVLSVVDRRDGREFRDYCRLACKVDAPQLRGQLEHRLTRARPNTEMLSPDQPSLLQAITQDKNIRRRARWVLEALEQNQPKGKKL